MGASKAQATNAVATVQNTGQALYGFDPVAVETIKNTVAKGATNHELALFLYTAQKLELDPLLKQIWFVKYGDKDPSIQVGRDGLLAIAQRDPGYETIISAAVYANDDFELDVVEGRVKHIIRKPADRGMLVGAYCIAPHKNRKPVVTWVDYKEYAASWGQRNPVWRTNPAEMIRKVAESQSIRRQYAISGVYVQGEIPEGDAVETYEAQTSAATKVTKEEVDQFLARAKEQGLTLDEVKQTFERATGRKTMSGWSRSRQEFEAWQQAVAELLEATSAAQEAEATAGLEAADPVEVPPVDPEAMVEPFDVAAAPDVAPNSGKLF